MLLFAVTALEKMQAVPLAFWLNLALGVLILVAAVILIRKAAEMNKVLLSVIIFVVVSGVTFHWVYSRNEPAFMTPFVDLIADFLPSAEKQAQKQKRSPSP